jgi:acetoin utilization deacetylase AcuC-like enzyme
MSARVIVVGPVGADHHGRPGHPERPERIGAVMAGVDDLHLGSDLTLVAARPADRHQLGLVHTAEYLDRLHRFCLDGGGALDPDTYATPMSWDTALLAAGSGPVAVDALRRAGDGVALVAARPPGHHALADRAMGFCLFNNVAVAAAALVESGERVLIVDWDVHHGNGTQAIFWDSPEVLYVSTHQWPCYPGSGKVTEVGGPGSGGTTVNVPLPPGATGDLVRRAFELMVTPAVDAFRPTWVLVSAGFDAHRADPLADLALSAGDFADLAGVVAGYAPGPGRMILFLEGGYHLGALRASVTATLGRLVGATAEPDEPDESPTSGGPGVTDLDRLAARRRQALESAG